jgi:hypothetical protein
MVFLLLAAFLAVLVLAKRFAFGAFFISVGVFAMAGCAAAGTDDPVSLRFVTMDESPLVAGQAGLQASLSVATFELTTAGYRAKSISILVHRNDLAELNEHIKYELRRGNITAEKAATLNHLIDEIEIEAAVVVPGGQVERTLIELTQAQAKLIEMLADTTNLVEALGSVRLPEFAGTFIAAKIQVVRLQAEKAGVDGSIDEIRQTLKRPKAG